MENNLNIDLRLAELKDKKTLFEWFNNLDSLLFKIKTNQKISFTEHEKWFESKLVDKNTYIWLIENNHTIPIGQIRFEYSKLNFYDVDIYIIENYRQLGAASQALQIAEGFFKLRPLRAIVKKNNNSSRLFFLKNNFSLYSENKDSWTLIKNT